MSSNKEALKLMGRVTIAFEVVEDKTNRLHIRAWTSSSERLMKILQASGFILAMGGLFGFYTMASIPVLIASIGAFFVGTGTGMFGFQRLKRLRRAWQELKKTGKPFEIEWTSCSTAGYRQARGGDLSINGTKIDGHELEALLVVNEGTSASPRWTVMFQLDRGIVELLPPYLGPIEELRPVVEDIARRCEVDYREQG